MERLIYDGAPEQIRRKTEFQCIMQKYDIRGQIVELERSKKNPFEGHIRELWRWWFRTMFRSYWPQSLWCYGIPHVAIIMQITALFAANIQGRTPLKALTGETPDISPRVRRNGTTCLWWSPWTDQEKDRVSTHHAKIWYQGTHSGIGEIKSESRWRMY